MVDENNFFPCLDMEMFWMENDDLNFCIHLKPNQQLKYLNSGSTHHPAVFKSTTMGVFERLTKLTSMNEEMEKMTIDELHPSHAEALKTAKLVPETHPTLRTTHDEENNEKRKKERNEKRKRHKDRRTVFFCIACSKHWKKPLPKTIQDLKKKHGLSWL